MKIEREKVWTEDKKSSFDLMGNLRPYSRIAEKPVTRVEIKVSEEMYIIMNGTHDTPSTFEVFIRYLRHLMSSGETLMSKSGIEFAVEKYHIIFDRMTQKQIAEVELVSVNKIDTDNTQYNEIDKKELLTTLIQSTPL